MKHIASFNLYILKENHHIDTLLDKIRKFGMNSINQKEKSYLDSGGEDPSIDLNVMEPNTVMSATLNGEHFTFVYQNTSRNPDCISYHGVFAYNGISTEATIICVAEDGRFNCILFKDDHEEFDQLGYLINHFCKEIVVRQLTNNYL